MRQPAKLTALLAACVLATAATHHPGHSSFAEVNFDAKRQVLQVSLAMLAIDFEETLSRRVGKRVNLDRTKGIGKIIEKYLADRFVVTLADGTKPLPSFAGREDKGKNVWIYFTVPMALQKAESRSTKSGEKKTSTLIGTRLRNRVLMGLNHQQRNTVEVRDGRWRRVLKFTERNPEQVLRRPARRDVKSPKGTRKKSIGSGRSTTRRRWI